jgi:hypothetical protein
MRWKQAGVSICAFVPVSKHFCSSVANADLQETLLASLSLFHTRAEDGDLLILAEKPPL